MTSPESGELLDASSGIAGQRVGDGVRRRGDDRARGEVDDDGRLVVGVDRERDDVGHRPRRSRRRRSPRPTTARLRRRRRRPAASRRRRRPRARRDRSAAAASAAALRRPRRVVVRARSRRPPASSTGTRPRTRSRTWRSRSGTAATGVAVTTSTPKTNEQHEQQARPRPGAWPRRPGRRRASRPSRRRRTWPPTPSAGTGVPWTTCTRPQADEHDRAPADGDAAGGRALVGVAQHAPGQTEQQQGQHPVEAAEGAGDERADEAAEAGR